MTTVAAESSMAQEELQAALRMLHEADRNGRVFDIRNLRAPLVELDQTRQRAFSAGYGTFQWRPR